MSGWMLMLWEFPESVQLPLADWITAFVEWLTVAGAPFFDAVSAVVLGAMVWLESWLLWLPWSLVVLVIAAIAWRADGWRLAAGTAASLVFIGVIGLWELAMTTLALVVVATVLAVVVAVPVGIAMTRSDLLEALVRPALDFMQTMPSFVYLVPALMFFSFGKVPALMATWIYAVPPTIRLTNLGIRQVSRDVVEAGEAFGSTPWQMLVEIELPLAMPSIMAGINQTVMMALAMVVIASMVGAGGLGAEVLTALQKLEVGRGFNGGISIVILAIIIDRLTQAAVGEDEGGAQSHA